MIYKKSWKYILTSRDTECSYLFRLKAVKDFSNVSKGNLGGYLEGYHNLSQFGNCWVYDKAQVYGNAHVSGNTRICDKARVCGYAQVFGDAIVSGLAYVYGHVQIFGNANIKNQTLTKGFYK